MNDSDFLVVFGDYLIFLSQLEWVWEIEPEEVEELRLELLRFGFVFHRGEVDVRIASTGDIQRYKFWNAFRPVDSVYCHLRY